MLVQIRRRPVYNGLWNEVADFEREVGKVFDSFLSGESHASESYTPAIQVVDNDSETVLVAELPGVAKEDVKITLDNNVLKISGERKPNQLPEKAQWLRNEFRSGKFSRSVRLPKGTDSGKISAEVSNGLLKVVLPKAEEVKPREIRIN